MGTAKTQLEAAEKGEMRFFTGRPCKHGHKDFRHTTSGACVKCVRLSAAKNREKIKSILAKAKGRA